MSKTNSVKFTKAFLDAYSLPEKGRAYIYDDKEPGLLAQITSSGKISFYLYKKIYGRPERLLLGHYPDFTIAQAPPWVLSSVGSEPPDFSREALGIGNSYN
jgi:hypothetical protein